MQIGHVWIIKLNCSRKNNNANNNKSSPVTVNIRATCTALIISTCTAVLITFFQRLKKKTKKTIFISDASATLWLHKGLQNISNLFQHLRTKYFHSAYLPSRTHICARERRRLLPANGLIGTGTEE